MSVLTQHPDLERSQRKRMSQGEAFGRHLFKKADDALEVDFKTWEQQQDFGRILDHYRRAVDVVRPIGTLMLIGMPADDVAAWVLGAEETYLIEVRLFWRDLLTSLIEEGCDLHSELDRMMHVTRAWVLPHTVS